MMPQGIFPFQNENEQQVDVTDMEIAWKIRWKMLSAEVGGFIVESARSFALHSG